MLNTIFKEKYTCIRIVKLVKRSLHRSHHDVKDTENDSCQVNLADNKYFFIAFCAIATRTYVYPVTLRTALEISLSFSVIFIDIA